jgi:hypothetical protein
MAAFTESAGSHGSGASMLAIPGAVGVVALERNARRGIAVCLPKSACPVRNVWV